MSWCHYNQSMVEEGTAEGLCVGERFVVDNEHVIIETGGDGAQALGGRCYELVRGENGGGQPVCGPRCPPMEALRQGAVTASAALRIPRSNGERTACQCDATALPDGQGAVVHLRSSGQRPGAGLDELAALGSLACSLSSESVEATLDRALACLRDITGADVTEAFLAEDDGSVALTGYQGPKRLRHAFFEISRFAPGEGYPGRVVSTGGPLLSCDVPNDPRYHRTAVKRQGFHCYACVPLPGRDGVIGSLHAAFRQPGANVAGAARLLGWASQPVGAALTTAMDRMRTAVENLPATEAGCDPSFTHLLSTVLERIVAVTGARGGALNVVAGDQGQPVRVTHGLSPTRSCRVLAAGNCPALTERGNVVRSGGAGLCPPLCQHRRRPAAACYCVPVPIAAGMGGVAELFYDKDRTDPPTRHLIAAAAAANAASHPIRAGWRTAVEAPRSAAAKALLDTQDMEPGYDGLDGRTEAPYLDIRCFGSFALYVRGSPITADQIHRRKTLVLLQLLLYYNGQPVPKETLIELLWPDAPSTRRVSQLYVLVCELRRLIEPQEAHDTPVFVRTQGDRYYFHFDERCLLDTRAFRCLVERGRRAETNGQSKAAMEAYQAAVGLYKGDFLEDERFAEWCWQEREYLRETCLLVLRRLANLLVEFGELTAAIEHLQRALNVDPLREDVHRELMYRLWTAGRRDEAIRQYEACRRVLQDELEVEPVPETQRLIDEMRSRPRP